MANWTGGGQFQGSGQSSGQDNSSSVPKNMDLLFALISDKSVFGRYYIKICEILKQQGVPVTRLPSKEHFMSRVFSCLDHKKVEAWIKQYSELESINIDEEADNDEGDE